MLKKIFVGNIPFDVAEDQMRALFTELGTVESAHLITDRANGRSRGFGFVEMSSGGDEAIAALHLKQLNGRSLQVNEARPRPERDSPPHTSAPDDSPRPTVIREETAQIAPGRSTE